MYEELRGTDISRSNPVEGADVPSDHCSVELKDARICIKECQNGCSARGSCTPSFCANKKIYGYMVASLRQRLKVYSVK